MSGSPQTVGRVDTGIYLLADGGYMVRVKRNGRYPQRTLGDVPLSEARACRDEMISELEGRGPRESFAARYEQAAVGLGDACPIEAGVIGALADNECAHGSLPTDRCIDCACWTDVRAARAAAARGRRVVEIVRPVYATVAERRPAVAQLYLDGMSIEEIAHRLRVSSTTIGNDLVAMRRAGDLTAYRNRGSGLANLKEAA